MENYLMINGKKIELTQEQVEQITGETEKNIFEPEEGETYYMLNGRGILDQVKWNADTFDRGYEENYNCCTDRAYMENLKLEQLLYRQLKQFSYLHGWKDELWEDCEDEKWYFYWSIHRCSWEVRSVYPYFDAEKVYFISEEIAQEALETIVKPFYQEHPNFQPWVKR